jgi:hypothetical protein
MQNRPVDDEIDLWAELERMQNMNEELMLRLSELLAIIAKLETAFAQNKLLAENENNS